LRRSLERGAAVWAAVAWHDAWDTCHGEGAWTPVTGLMIADRTMFCTLLKRHALRRGTATTHIVFQVPMPCICMAPYSATVCLLAQRDTRRVGRAVRATIPLPGIPRDNRLAGPSWWKQV